MEILLTDTKKSRLTITTERVTVKLPLNTTEEYNNKAIQIAINIVEDIKNKNISLKYTLRAQLNLHKAIVFTSGSDSNFYRYIKHLPFIEPKTGDIVVYKGENRIVYYAYEKGDVSLCLKDYEEAGDLVESDTVVNYGDYINTNKNIFDKK